MTSESTVNKIVKETNPKNGFRMFETTMITKHLSSMSKTSKYMLLGYAAFVGISFATSSYVDGKKRLFEFRGLRAATGDVPARAQNLPKFTDYYGKAILTEWDSVYDGCTRNMGCNFWESLTFPFSYTAKIMPWIVLTLNPPPKND
jgi:hypothetical protein